VHGHGVVDRDAAERFGEHRMSLHDARMVVEDDSCGILSLGGAVAARAISERITVS
jgi:hypothetical protein